MRLDQIKAGALLSYLALVVSSAINFLYMPYMLRMLGKAEFGVYSLVNTTMMYLTVLDFGFGTAIVRYAAKYKAEKDTAREDALYGTFFLLYLVIGVVAFSIALLVILNIDTIFAGKLTAAELGTAKSLMWLAALNVSVGFPFSVYASIITAYERFVFAKSLLIIRQILTPLLMVLVLSIGYKSKGMIVITTIIGLVCNFMNLYYCKRHLHLKIKFHNVDYTLLKEITGFSFFIFLNLVVDQLYWSSGQFLLGMFAGSSAVAVYTIGIQLVNMLYINVSNASSGLFLPRVTRLSVVESSHEDLSNLFVRVGRIQFMMLALVLLGFGLYGRFFINLWAGPDYSESFFIALIMMIPLTVPLTQTLGISILQASNKHSFRSIVYVIIAVINLAVSVPLLRLWGPIGCAVGTALSVAVGQIVVMNCYYSFRLKIQIKKFWYEIIKLFPSIIFPFILGKMLLLVVSAQETPGFCINVSVFVCIYMVSLYTVGLNAFEKELVISPLKRMAQGLTRVKE